MHRSDASPVDSVLRSAAEQRGLITWAQVIRSGLSDHHRRRLIEEGWLRRVRPGVYAVGRHADSRWDPAVAAVLRAGPGSVLSHGTAAGINRLPGLARPTRGIEITVPLPRHPQLREVTVHRVVRLDAADVAGRPPLIFTAAPRTLLDLAGRIPVELLASVVDERSGRRSVDDRFSPGDHETGGRTRSYRPGPPGAPG